MSYQDELTIASGFLRPGLRLAIFMALAPPRSKYIERGGARSTLKIEVDNSGCDGVSDKSIEICGRAEIAVLFRMLDRLRAARLE